MKAPLRFAILYERKVILLLCAIGALRVFIFSAAFPFFNNVDEQAHVDLVMKYARGHVPRDLVSILPNPHITSLCTVRRSSSWLRSSSRRRIFRRQTGCCPL